MNDEKLLEVAGGKGDIVQKLGSMVLTAGVLSSVPSGFAMEGDRINGIIPPRPTATHRTNLQHTGSCYFSQ